jgi:hypothetical protein
MSAAQHAVLGLGIVGCSGMQTACFPVSMKLSRSWSWDHTWFVYATLVLVIISVSLAASAGPHMLRFYASIRPQNLLLPLLLGFASGIAQVTFGLSIARVGMEMAFAIVIGLSALLDSFIPLLVFHPAASPLPASPAAFF